MIHGKNSSISDKAGIGSALLCTVHCLVIPLFFIIKFTWLEGNTAFNLPPWWEKLDYFFLLISFLAVYHSAGHTKVKEIKIALWAFWGILAIAILFEARLHNMAYVASAGLITTHFINIRRMTKPVQKLGNKQIAGEA